MTAEEQYDTILVNLVTKTPTLYVNTRACEEAATRMLELGYVRLNREWTRIEMKKYIAYAVYSHGRRVGMFDNICDARELCFECEEGAYILRCRVLEENMEDYNAAED